MLRLEGVTKRFNLTGNKEDLTIALDNVDLAIAPGEFVTIIGGNGSGKSTSMNIISGVLKPDSGKVTLNGVDITGLTEYQRAQYFGRVFQDPMMGTAGDMSVLENLEIASRRGKKHSPFSWGFKKSNKQRFINELKRFDLGLETKLNQKVGLMSGGQRQALTLLMATMKNAPTYKQIKRDYVKFNEGDKKQAAIDFDNGFNAAKTQLNDSIARIKADKILTSAERRRKIAIAKGNFDREIRKFDLTKQILLLDEHTAALDPKTARKVLELTDKIVKENNMTTLMVTHNLADAIRYGDRLIMFSQGHIVFDVKGEEKSKLTKDDLFKLFSGETIKAENA